MCSSSTPKIGVIKILEVFLNLTEQQDSVSERDDPVVSLNQGGSLLRDPRDVAEL